MKCRKTAGAKFSTFFEKAVRRVNRPHFRRAKAGAKFMNLAKEYVLQGDDRRNKKNNWGGNTNHVEVRAGGFLCLKLNRHDLGSFLSRPGANAFLGKSHPVCHL